MSLETDKSAFNLSSLLVQELNYTLLKSIVCYCNNDPSGAFNFLKATKMRFVQHLKKEERDALTSEEIKALGKIKTYEIALAKTKAGFVNERIIVETVQEPLIEAKAAVEKYNELILDTMEAYGLLMKKQKDKTKIN